MNKSWGGNLIIGTLVETSVTNDKEETETVASSTVDEEKKTETKNKKTKIKKIHKSQQKI